MVIGRALWLLGLLACSGCARAPISPLVGHDIADAIRILGQPESTQALELEFNRGRLVTWRTGACTIHITTDTRSTILYVTTDGYCEDASRLLG